MLAPGRPMFLYTLYFLGCSSAQLPRFLGGSLNLHLFYDSPTHYAMDVEFTEFHPLFVEQNGLFRGEA